MLVNEPVDHHNEIFEKTKKSLINQQAKTLTEIGTKEDTIYSLLKLLEQQQLLLSKVATLNQNHVLFIKQLKGKLKEQSDLINDQKKMINHLEEEKLTKSIFFTKIKKIITRLCSPKLGKLNHYQPTNLVVPEKYKKHQTFSNLPSISIVTPSFNQGSFLEKTLTSVLDQHYPNLEYVVQDGNSGDETVYILEKYHSSLAHWESVKDGGQSHALNLGFKHTSGEIMGYLNSDDMLLPGSLHYVGEFFAKNPKIDVIYGHRILIDENDKEIGRWVLPRHDNKILSWADYIPQETLFWRRNIWEKTGSHIDENFLFAMDWDLILRFREAGAKFARLPRFLGAFRVHSTQKTSSQLNCKGEEEMNTLRQRCIGKKVDHLEIRNGIRNYLLKHVMYHKLYRLGILNY